MWFLAPISNGALYLSSPTRRTSAILYMYTQTTTDRQSGIKTFDVNESNIFFTSCRHSQHSRHSNTAGTPTQQALKLHTDLCARYVCLNSVYRGNQEGDCHLLSGKATRSAGKVQAVEGAVFGGL
ncbi:hypothetical protein RRG08_009905 [Elysia crispata]|uniref:Uncharacterized protein n=1 Tax=Elysia crispata TaxID=231223 RepID=A0AAE0Y9B8_9GAST|nr:hypothetical protein RRG08_009905 [Elysia crispata]